MKKPESKLILYTTQDGNTDLQVILDNETVWLTQKQMAELFQKDRSVITKHIRNVFAEGELHQESVSAFFAHTAADGKSYKTSYYDLNVIISVGYRVKSHRGTQFRIWATKTLREYIVKGFVIDDERLEGKQTNYFDELVERVRKIRTSEKNFYQKVRDVFATSIDYDPRTDFARQFYAMVQNKFHYAITGYTAAELVAKRVSSEKKNLGLTSWAGQIVTRKDARVAKNYLEELELKRLTLLVDQFLSFAELRSLEQNAMYMQDWLKKLDEFLILNEKEILKHSGKVSHKAMEEKVRVELEKYTHKQLEDKSR